MVQDRDIKYRIFAFVDNLSDLLRYFSHSLKEGYFSDVPVNIPQTLLFMAALWNRAGHYIFMLWFLSSLFYLSSFFPRLISAVGDWMSTILRHMVWP